MRKETAHFLSACVLLLLTGTAAKADLMDFLGVTDLSKRVEDGMNSILTQRIDQFLGGMDQLSGRMINDGSNQGRLMLVQAGNEMQVTISTIRSQYSAEMDKTIEKSSRELQPLLRELEKWRVVQNELADKVIELEDAVAMDLDKVPFTGDYFGIRRTYGTVLVPDASDVYRLKIVGPRFGQVIPNETVTVTADLDGIDLGQPAQVPPNAVEFNIQAASVKSKFDQEKIVTIPLHVKVKRVRDGWFYDDATELQQDLRVVLLPKVVGTVSVQTERPQYEWVTTGVQSDTAVIRADRVFSLQVSRPVTTDAPEEGNERLSRQVEANCSKVSQNARRFPNGRVILESDEIFTRGWTVSFWIGADEGPDWDRSHNEALNTWGINVSFWRMRRCVHNQHCYLTADEMRSWSELTKIDVEDCSRMQRAEENWFENDSRVTLWIRGAARQDSLWRVSAPVETYRETSLAKDPLISKPLSHGELVQIDIENPAKTATMVTFVPKNGKPMEWKIGLSLPGGPQFEGTSEIGSHKLRYLYRYTYDTRNWDSP